MLDAVLWLIGAQALGLAAIPVAYLAFGGLRDRGITLAKPLGILLVGYLTWILSSAHILPASWPGPLFALLVLATIAVLIIHRRRAQAHALAVEGPGAF